MCRHLAYLGVPVTVGELLVEPPYALLRQSWAPRRQRSGTVNADGFGIGWYADGDPVPARYRSDRPMWSDPFVADMGRVVRTRALLAAVRSATSGMPHSVGAAAPFVAGEYLFSHNGAVPGWPERVAAITADPADATPAEVLIRAARQDAATDSVMLWALVRSHLDRGRSAAEALAAVVRLAASTAGGRLNLLLTDGHSIAATVWGDTLCWRATRGGVVVASEPYDDEPGWTDLPDRSLLTATPDGVSVGPLILDVPPAAR